MDIYQAIASLVTRAVEQRMIEPEDEIYCKNRIINLLGLTEYVEREPADLDIPELLEMVTGYAAQNGVIEDLFDLKEVLSSAVMDVFLPKPSQVDARFHALYRQSPAMATEDFYRFSRVSNNIQTRRIAKNISYKTPTKYGDLDITINLSKPEKNPKDIAAAKLLKSADYPKCLLCVENEGYAGKIGHPGRASHRMIRLNLCGEPWYFQYSPYVYYNEHCIVLSRSHRDMAITRQTFERLLSFVEWLPHYFLGSNADLPIVGGSILTHDHYQGGNYEFAMAKAKADYYFELPGFEQLTCSVVKWPMSVIRMAGPDKDTLVRAAMHIHETWKGYSDPSADILCETGGAPHNTVTPIARRKGDRFELDVVLRNNRTSPEHPLGIFHPHEDVQHIKKENIGLIEVMGLAGLPARLVGELNEVEKFLLGLPSEVADYHRPWAEEMKVRYQNALSEANVHDVVQQEVGRKFERVLEDAGVFKRDEPGRAAFARFIKTL